MFLNRLSMSEREAFLELAYYIANVDSDFADTEAEIIAKYCMEMQLDDIEFNASAFDLHTCLNSFESEGSKKIVLLEIMALVYADSALVEQEDAALSEIIDHFELNPNLAIVYREWAKSILSLFVQGEALIHI